MVCCDESRKLRVFFYSVVKSGKAFFYVYLNHMNHMNYRYEQKAGITINDAFVTAKFSKTRRKKNETATSLHSDMHKGVINLQ